MNKKNLMPISIKVLDVLKEEQVQDEDVLEVLKNVYNNIAAATSYSIDVEEVYFNLLKDTVWYNLEKGSTKTLSNYGSKYITFMNAFENDNIVRNEDIDSFLKNLKDIKSKLNNDSILASLSGSEDLFVQTAPVYFVGQKAKKKKNSVICRAENAIGSCHMEKIKLFSILDGFIEKSEKALQTGGYIEVNFH